MNNEITAEEVAHQFAKSIQLFLEWMEQRGKAGTLNGMKVND